MSDKLIEKNDVRFRLFRGGEGRPCDIMSYDAPDDAAIANSKRMAEAGSEQGHHLRILFDIAGLSLARAWFKSGYTLPRHTHDVDCVYYITGGSLRIGTEELGTGDGFFVGAHVPYAYSAGPEGVEILEFRPSNSFDIKVMGGNDAFMDKAIAIVQNRQEAWAKETVPPKPN